MRAPAKPNSPQQEARVQRILRAAARQGAGNGLERVQMQEVAKESGVAIATLYRYFPSKMHLFTAVMQAQIDRIQAYASPPACGDDPVEAVTRLLLEATRQMLGSPLLAHAMMVSNNAAIHATEAEAGQTSASFTQLLLDTAGREKPGDRDIQLARLVEQAWYGVLTAALNQRTPHEQVVDDLRVTCQLLLADWSTT
ncbi:TetR family transcriptional regulator [Nocardioides sp. JQ2195]|uniref:TetR family transcriptional regulator n=1 Tax=Nocardioides sp. JQ2195 TaxID=2592334 RepID=UPI001981E38F|nr:TetR family transcriptional regulator [Nocardioides sp. JQ2195]